MLSLHLAAGARTLAGLAALLLAGAAFGASLIEAGIAAYQSGDYPSAIEKWQDLIKAERAEGWFFMGVMHAEGKGVAQDHAKAHAFYREAAQKNHAAAQYNLANQYASGEGVKLDYAQAEHWWTRAAEQGLVDAQINLGNFYYYGVGGERQLDLARKWLTAALNQGSAEAKETLGKLDAHEAKPAAARPAADTLRREAWVLAQPAARFTIQILATAAQAVAREFIEQHGLTRSAAYVESQLQGNAVFRVVYGNYATREQADKALAGLPRALNANSPWVRSFAEMHKLVDRRYAQRGAQ
ncbi:MAG: hypothetical protein FJY56_15345 [Betaproteobacteria bacterium]|nr:hypothetical protein [Betaproteobacteria bacterium]